jgi:hypothetical protein
MIPWRTHLLYVPVSVRLSSSDSTKRAPQALLGRLYLTTASHLDGIRNLFTFNTEALSSAELGKYDHACEGRPSTGQPDTADNAHMAAAPSEQSLPAEMIKVCIISSEHFQSYKRPQLIAILLRVVLVLSSYCGIKLQGMLLLFHERISALEKQLAAGGGRLDRLPPDQARPDGDQEQHRGAGLGGSARKRKGGH